MSHRMLRVSELERVDVIELGENIEDLGGLDRELASEAGLFLATMSVVDVARTAFLAALIGTRFPGVHALMTGVVNAGARRRAVDECCKVLMSEADYALAKAVLSEVGRLEVIRNQLAHGLWSWARFAPKELLLIKPRDFAPYLGAIQASRRFTKALGGDRPVAEKLADAATRFLTDNSEKTQLDPARVVPYNIKELHAVRVRADRAGELLSALRELQESIEHPETVAAARTYLEQRVGALPGAG